MFLIWFCSCLFPIHWSQVLSWEWKCSWSNAERQCSNYFWVLHNFIAYLSVNYIRGFKIINFQTTHSSCNYALLWNAHPKRNYLSNKHSSWWCMSTWNIFINSNLIGFPAWQQGILMCIYGEPPTKDDITNASENKHSTPCQKQN